MIKNYCKEFFPVSKWQVVDYKTFYDWNDEPHYAICVQIGELVTYEVNQLGTCPKRYPALRWMPLNEYRNYFTKQNDTIIW